MTEFSKFSNHLKPTVANHFWTTNFNAGLTPTSYNSWIVTFHKWIDITIGGKEGAAINNGIPMTFPQPNPESLMLDDAGAPYTPAIFLFDHCPIDQTLNETGRAQFKLAIEARNKAVRELVELNGAIFTCILSPASGIISDASLALLISSGNQGSGTGSPEYRQCIESRCVHKLVSHIIYSHDKPTSLSDLGIFKMMQSIEDNCPVPTLKRTLERIWRELKDNWATPIDGKQYINLETLLLAIYKLKRSSTLFALDNAIEAASYQDIRKHADGQLWIDMNGGLLRYERETALPTNVSLNATGALPPNLQIPLCQPTQKHDGKKKFKKEKSPTRCERCFREFGHESFHYRKDCNNEINGRTKTTHPWFDRRNPNYVHQPLKLPRAQTRPSSPTPTRTSAPNPQALVASSFTHPPPSPPPQQTNEDFTELLQTLHISQAKAASTTPIANISSLGTNPFLVLSVDPDDLDPPFYTKAIVNTIIASLPTKRDNSPPPIPIGLPEQIPIGLPEQLPLPNPKYCNYDSSGKSIPGKPSIDSQTSTSDDEHSLPEIADTHPNYHDQSVYPTFNFTAHSQDSEGDTIPCLVNFSDSDKSSLIDQYETHPQMILEHTAEHATTLPPCSPVIDSVLDDCIVTPVVILLLITPSTLYHLSTSSPVYYSVTTPLLHQCRDMSL